MEKPKNIFSKIFGAIKRRIFLYSTINWLKTFYFNFKMLPFHQAKKLPFIFFGKVSFQDLSGKVTINGPIRTAMIGFGQKLEKIKKSKGIGEIALGGKLIFNGNAVFGKDVFLGVEKNATCEFGYGIMLGSDVKLICTQKIYIGDWSRVGFESQLIDSNLHPMMNSQTGEHYPMQASIIIKSHNSISNRVSIMMGTTTPDYCVIASNSVCNKDYTDLGNNILLGGIPAKILKNNYTRDWEREKPLLEIYQGMRL